MQTLNALYYRSTCLRDYSERWVPQDVRGRAEILEYYLSSKPVAPDVDVMRLARATPGAAPAACALEELGWSVCRQQCGRHLGLGRWRQRCVI
jgi:hypothetical protein